MFDPNYAEILEKRLRYATYFILVVFCILILRLWLLQIVHGPAYRAKSEHNRIQSQTVAPIRGMIYDRNGKILVCNRPSYDLYATLEGIRDKGALVKSLNQLIVLDTEPIAQILDKSHGIYPHKPVCLKKDITRDEVAIIETHRYDLPEIMVIVKPQRHYLYGSLAAHLLGYVGEIDKNQLHSQNYPNSRVGDMVGKSGIEKEWQPFLNGISGNEQIEVDAAGRRIRLISWKPPISGKNIGLTIDSDLQVFAENLLKGKKGAIVAINPNNGAVLAMASSPSYNPNLFIEGIDSATWEKIVSSKESPLQNRALTGLYAPGSLFKIILSVAALQEGIVSPKDEILCKGVYRLEDHQYRCWRKHGKVDLRKALVESCDTYFYEVGRRLGIDTIAKYAFKFGLGMTTGFNGGYEKEGLIPTKDWKLKKRGTQWKIGETISLSIGQSSILVTPIQMAVVISATFNGGFLYKPQVINWLGRTETESTDRFTPTVIGKLDIKPEYLEHIKSALIDSVNEPSGTGFKEARLEGVTVAGKTGTSQVISLDKIRDAYKNKSIPIRFRDHGWFVAVAPAENPQIALSIVVEHGGHGGEAAAPLARKLISHYLSQ